MEAEMKFRPLQDRILVKRVDSEVKTAGGIIIPNSAQEKPQEGLVVAMGNGKRLEDGTQIPMDLAKGDSILFGKYSGSEVKIYGEDHLILREDEILGVMEK
jgi:chaperonin GroES